ncbi:MAG: Aldose 1-epimerase [Actinomycetia bacterium]|nr:Aldose 1-epimerase [Actinomycetes bacterium]
MAEARLGTWHGEPAVTLSAGDLATTFLPSVSMLGVSLAHRGEELLAPVAPLARYRAGHVTGIPILHPWANRLAQRRYRVGRLEATVAPDAPVDRRGLPIHGTVHGLPFDVAYLGATAGRARLVARLDAAAQPSIMTSFPFPHLLEIEVTVRATTPNGATELRVRTTVRATGRRAVPVSFGWHPYFKLPDASRAAWRLRLPARRHETLDARQLPTGAFVPEPAEDRPIAGRTFDDHYALGRDRRFELATARRCLTLRFDRNYPYAQIYVPAGKTFAAIEPMVAPVNALVDRRAPLVPAGGTFTATWRATIA